MISEVNGVDEYSHALQAEFLTKHRTLIFNSTTTSPDVFDNGARSRVWSEDQCITSNAYLLTCSDENASGTPQAGRRLLGHVAGAPCVAFTPRD
eukprot:4161268-Pyramimonas_sp.AAC.1